MHYLYIIDIIGNTYIQIYKYSITDKFVGSNKIKVETINKCMQENVSGIVTQTLEKLSTNYSRERKCILTKINEGPNNVVHSSTELNRCRRM